MKSSDFLIPQLQHRFSRANVRNSNSCDVCLLHLNGARALPQSIDRGANWKATGVDEVEEKGEKQSHYANPYHKWSFHVQNIKSFEISKAIHQIRNSKLEFQILQQRKPWTICLHKSVKSKWQNFLNFQVVKMFVVVVTIFAGELAK